MKIKRVLKVKRSDASLSELEKRLKGFWKTFVKYGVQVKVRPDTYLKEFTVITTSPKPVKGGNLRDMIGFIADMQATLDACEEAREWIEKNAKAFKSLCDEMEAFKKNNK